MLDSQRCRPNRPLGRLIQRHEVGMGVPEEPVGTRRVVLRQNIISFRVVVVLVGGVSQGQLNLVWCGPPSPSLA